jgi:wyosine [tRNA(Phe)-imidazoG37] synthetase (radical SAM superfamily)
MIRNDRTFQCIINDRCNNNCLFCIDRNDGKSAQKNKDCFSHNRTKSHLQLVRLLHKAALKTKNIIFTGPEPTLNNALIEYVKTAKAAGFTNIRLITNARRLSYMAYAKALISSGLTEIIVSLHGSNRKIHDALTRTKGSFEQTTKACSNLNSLRQRHQFVWRINITLNAINAGDLLEFYRLALRFKTIASIGVNTVIPSGNGLVFLDRLSPNYTYLAESFKNALAGLKSPSPQRIGLGIVGLPVCLFKKVEHIVGIFETALINKNKTVRIEERDPERIKGKLCAKCKYVSTCAGVWKPYIKRYGWKEFIPVL